MRNKGGSFNRGGHDFSKVPSVDIQRSTFRVLMVIRQP